MSKEEVESGRRGHPVPFFWPLNEGHMRYGEHTSVWTLTHTHHTHMCVLRDKAYIHTNKQRNLFFFKHPVFLYMEKPKAVMLGVLPNIAVSKQHQCFLKNNSTFFHYYVVFLSKPPTEMCGNKNTIQFRVCRGLIAIQTCRSEWQSPRLWLSGLGPVRVILVLHGQSLPCVCCSSWVASSVSLIFCYLNMTTFEIFGC